MNGLKLKPNLKNIAILCMILTPHLILPFAAIASIINTSTPLQDFEEPNPIQGIEPSFTPKTAGVNLPVVNSPPNIWRRPGDAAYVEWIASDADVSPGDYAGYYMVNGSDGHDSTVLPWYSGEPLNFPIPGAYSDNSWTVYVYDLDGNMVSDTIGTTWWDAEDHPLLESITIVQDGEESDIKDKPYIETGKGNFQFKLNWEEADMYQPVTILGIPVPGQHNRNKIREVTTELRGYYPNFGFNFYIPALGGTLPLHCDALTPDGYWVIFIPVITLLSNDGFYSSIPNFVKGGTGMDSFTLTIGPNTQYTWRTWALLENNPVFQQIFNKKVQDVEYRVENQFTLRVYTGDIFTTTDYFVYDQMRYNRLFNIDLENKDVNAPTCESQNATQADDESNLKIEASIADEFKGSGVDVDKVTLYYSVNEGSWESTRMLYVKEDGVFKGNVPPPGAGSSVVYYIEMYDMEGNVQNTEHYTFVSPTKPIPPVVVTLIGIVAVAIGAVAVTIIYRKRNQPAIITLPTKKKVDKYYKKINKEEG
jgi:hypothetical protein